MKCGEKWVPLVIARSATIGDALQKIDENKKGFLVVLEETGQAYGTLTEGDIRRALIHGLTLSDSVKDACHHPFYYLNISDDISSAAVLFQGSKIDFIPILDENRMLVNVITREQFQALFLQDIQGDLSFDFFSLDHPSEDNEIYFRPWGFYKTTFLNQYFRSKVISVKPEGKLSLQSHNFRQEYWTIVHGEGLVQMEQSFVKVQIGSTLFIPKGTKHRIENTSKDQTLIFTEVQIGEYLEEDDIVRYEDIYGRV